MTVSQGSAHVLSGDEWLDDVACRGSTLAWCTSCGIVGADVTAELEVAKPVHMSRLAASQSTTISLAGMSHRETKSPNLALTL
jgi:hypothetical protein